MAYHRNRELAAFAFTVAVSRFIFRSHDLYDLDSVNFALGIMRFDPRVHQPHPPGYFLYICCGRVLAHLVHDPNLALVLLSIAASCGAVVFIYLLALHWFGQLAARFAAALFLLSPLAWFHGIVALTYSVEAFFSAAIGYLCWLTFRGDCRWIPCTALLLGISAGVRPSSLLLLGPLFLLALYRAPVRHKLTALAVLALTVLAWFVPMLRASGGLQDYFHALQSLWRLVPSRTTALNSSPVNSIARAITILFIYLLTFGAASLAPILSSQRREFRSAESLFTAFWVLPALCFFTLIYLKFVNSGYLLLLAPAGCLWLGSWLSDWYQESRIPLSAKRGILALGALANIGIFLFSPLYCSYRSVRNFEAQLRHVDETLAQVAKPDNALIVAFDSHFLGFRHAGYFLPQYQVIEYPEVSLQEGTRIFAMHGQQTSLLSGLPPIAADRFIFFPLPQDDSRYPKYLESVKARLPSGTLQTLRVQGVEFITGPISCLGWLFPKTVSAASGKQCVSAVPVARGPVYNRAHPERP